MSLVLIVEDNERNLKLVRDVLGFAGFSVLEARDAEAGIELARAQKPDVVLMDINLPGMTGFEALTALRADVATAFVPVIMITASGEAA